MKITTLQSQYTQKSKIFLYPLLGIKRGTSITPIQTYLQWAGYYSTEDCRLICHYHQRVDQEFKRFEEKVLLNDPYFDDYFRLEDDSLAYVFDFGNHVNDYQNIVAGKYSQLSDEHKNIVSSFFLNNPNHHARVLSYLIPDRFYADYAELYGVRPELLKQVGELCSIPDMEKETFDMLKKITNFELLNNSINTNL
jgi:hypothetical protein